MPRAKKKAPAAARKRKAATPKPRARAASRSRASARPGAARPSGLTARDVMARDVVTVDPATSVDVVSSIFQLHNINGCPVVDDEGRLIGIVTEDDLVFGRMGATDEEMASPPASNKAGSQKTRGTHFVAEIMTPNPIAAEEETPIEELCRLMCRLRIHRIPIVRNQRVTGIVSSLDVCRLLADGSAGLTLRRK